jgi:hypothetical protein
LKPWPPPSGGFEPLMRESRWARGRQPLSRGKIIAGRATAVLTGVYCGVVFSIEPAQSLWWQAGLALLIGVVTSLVVSSPHQLAQILGLRPPAAVASTRRDARRPQPGRLER